MTPVPIRRALASLPVNATKSRRNKNKEMAIPSRGWLHSIDTEGNSLLGRCAEQPLVVGLQRNHPLALREHQTRISGKEAARVAETWRNPARSAWLPPAKPLLPAKVFMTPSSNSESHRHLGGSRWPTSAPDRRDGFRDTRRSFSCLFEPVRWHESAGRLLDSLRGKQRDRAAFEGLPRDSGSVLARDTRFHNRGGPSQRSAPHSM
jgi:hypothetical protein